MKTILLLALLCHVSAQAIVLEAYGDSLTAGFFSSDKNLEDPPSLKEVSAALSDLAMYAVTADPKYREPHEYRNYAWPARLAAKLAQHHGVKIDWRNFGETGANTTELPKQLEKLEKGTHWRSIGIVFIGHNDFADFKNLSVDEVKERHRSALSDFLRQWDKRHGFSTMVIVPVGEVHKVYRNLKGITWHKGDTTYSCEDSWEKFFPYARTYYQLMKQGILDEYFIPRIQGYHEVEREVAREWNWKSLWNNYYYFDAKEPFNYDPKNFSIDCFHVAEKGQERVAQTIFNSMTGAELELTDFKKSYY